MKPILWIALWIAAQLLLAAQNVPVGTIHGTATRPDGQRAAGVSIELAKPVNQYGQRLIAPVGRSTETDAGGEYRFAVPPGEYYVRTVARAADSTARTYSPDIVDPEKAATIAVAPGSDMVADVHLSATPVFKVSGSIVDSTSGSGNHYIAGIYLTNRRVDVRDDVRPLSSGGVCLSCFNSDRAPFSNVFLSLTGNQFEIRGIRPGSYDLYASIWVGDLNPSETFQLIVPGVPLKTSVPFEKRMPVEVTNIDVTGLIVEVARTGIDIAGRFVINGNADTTALSIPTLIGIDNNPLRQWTADFDNQGGFKFKNVFEGTYSVRMDLTPFGAYVADVRQGGKSIYDSGFTVGSEPVEPLEVIVSPGGVIGGHIDNGGGAKVVLVPSERRNYSSLVRVASANPEGDYRILGIVPGQYRILAFDDASFTKIESIFYPEFANRNAAMGVPVTVTFGSPQKIPLALVVPK